MYAARVGDSTALWYRSLRTGDARLIAGTTGATAPRVSPDGSLVAFLLGERVMVVGIAGGQPRQLLQGTSTSWLAWTAAKQLLVADADGNRLNWLDPDGGASRSQAIARCGFGGVWLESTRQLLCSANRVAVIVDPASGKSWTIRRAGTNGNPGALVIGSSFRLVDGHYLVYIASDGALVAAPFNLATRIAGKAVALLSGVRREGIGEAQYDIDAHGSLIYAPGVDATVGRMVRLVAGEAPKPLPIEAADFQRYDLSRDGRWFAAAVQGVDANELRVYDLHTGQHFTWLRGEYIRHPLWNPSGETLLVGAGSTINRWSILRGTPNMGAPPDTLLTTDMVAASGVGAFDPIDFHDDHLALTADWSASTVMWFDPSAVHPTFDTVLSTGARFSSLSSDGKLILYQTQDGNHVMVTTFPHPGRRWQVASEGLEPLWLSPTEVLARVGVSWYLARINPATGEPIGPPTFWARDPRFSDTPGWSNRPSHDGGIIYIESPAEVTANHLRVIPNWVAQMEAAVNGGAK